MKRINFAPKLTFGDLKDIKSFKFIDAAWRRLEEPDLKKLTLYHLLFSDMRMLVEFKFDGQTFRLSTHEEDCQLIRKKYPKDYAVCLKQILSWFKKDLELNEATLKILIPLSIFEAKIK